MQNASDKVTAASAAQSERNNQSQIPVLQPSDSQRGSSGSAGSNLAQQTQTSAMTDAVGQVETNMEVWTLLSLPLYTVQNYRTSSQVTVI